MMMVMKVTHMQKHEIVDRRQLDRSKVIEHHSKRTAFAYDRLGNEFD